MDLAFELEEGVRSLGPDERLVFSHRDGRISAWVIDISGAQPTVIGALRAIPAPTCKNAFSVIRAAAKKGYGPILYDLAMELAGDAGLTSDFAGSTSGAASNVWAGYEKRGDVEVEDLPDAPGTPRTATAYAKPGCKTKIHKVFRTKRRSALSQALPVNRFYDLPEIQDWRSKVKYRLSDPDTDLPTSLPKIPGDLD